jgi:superfamily II DNA or RNA helicase
VTPIACTVAGDLVLHDLPIRPLERLRKVLSYPNSKYSFAKRNNWSTGTELETIECIVEMPDGSVHVPRGAIGVVKETFARDGYVVKVTEDRRSIGKTIGPFPSIPLRDYQADGVQEFLKHTQGVIVLPCGSGKSRLGVGAIAALGRDALIVVPTQDLADQWIKDLQEHLGYEGGLIGGGIFRWRDITVGVDDSVVNAVESDLVWAASFGCIIIDECHSVPSRTAQRILNNVPAKWRLGLTATSRHRSDGADPLLGWTMGPVLLERTTKQLIATGVLMPADIDLVETGWSFSYRGPEKKRVTAMEAAITEDLARNALIVDRVAQDVAAGETVLVLSNRKGHTKELESCLVARGVQAIALTSATAKKKRKTTIANLREGELPVMIATSLADTGLDVPRLSRVHLAFPQRARGGTLQRLGRLLRDWPGKKPRLVDYVDSDVPTLARRAQERRKVYRETGLLRED